MQATAANAPLRVESSPESEPHVRALFHIVGVADPSLLPRIVAPVAKLGFVPTRLHASAEDGDGSRLSIDLRLGDVPGFAAQRIEAALRSVVGVVQVIAVYEAA